MLFCGRLRRKTKGAPGDEASCLTDFCELIYRVQDLTGDRKATLARLSFRNHFALG